MRLRARPVRLRGSLFSARRSAQGDIRGVILSSSRQGAMADGALCVPPCPQRLPLLFPKISLRCDFREPCKVRAEGSLKTKPSLSSRASAEGSCFERQAVPNTAKKCKIEDNERERTALPFLLKICIFPPLRAEKFQCVKFSADKRRGTRLFEGGGARLFQKSNF